MPKRVWITSDGQHFDTMREAEMHEGVLQIAEVLENELEISEFIPEIGDSDEPSVLDKQAFKRKCLMIAGYIAANRNALREPIRSAWGSLFDRAKAKKSN
jgi:hypothetical protein